MSDKGGRPTLYTQDLAEAICKHLEIGVPLGLAAEAEGVPRETAYTWEREDRKITASGVEMEDGFSRLVARAKGKGAVKLAGQALEGGKGSAMAGWMLERRYRDDYAPPRKEEVQPSEVRITIEGGLPRAPKGDSEPG